MAEEVQSPSGSRSGRSSFLGTWPYNMVSRKALPHFALFGLCQYPHLTTP
jgi:hypothetical protein